MPELHATPAARLAEWRAAPVAVRITDLLGEEVLVVTVLAVT